MLRLFREGFKLDRIAVLANLPRKIVWHVVRERKAEIDKSAKFGK